MNLSRSSTALLAVAVVAAGLLSAPASAEPGPAPAGPDRASHTTRDFGNGAERNEVAAATPDRGTSAFALPEVQPRRWAPARQGYPRQTELPLPPENPADKSIKLGLVPYHGIAPRLNALQEESDRVSAEVVGHSALGRDLYLVTVTAPETPAEAARQDRWRALIENGPGAAERDPRLRRHYKAPVWINANIHGDEWEGSDGALRVIERLATAGDAATARLLSRTRIYVTVTNNPDGRVAGTRANGAGFDINRDHATSSQPESRAVRDVVVATQPFVMLDEHGYTGTTLIEPATPPHGQNYEYDLYIKHALPNAEGMEEAIRKLGHPETARADIPFRDYAPGDWDDWPPIFTPMYAIYQGAVGHTVEIPWQVNRNAYETLPVEELRRRSAVNTDVAAATIEAAIAYADTNRTALLADQIEQFRRGWAGEPSPSIPDGFVEGFGPEDRYTTTFPRAYVIPGGSAQRSPAAAARLVDHLVVHDVRVTRARHAFALAGRAYPAGSYIVDMRQPKRGLANVLLEAGRDISALVPQMYDISGWSHRLLWGASVDISATAVPRVAATAVSVASPTGGVDAPQGRDLALSLRDGADVRAVNVLIDTGVAVRRADAATVLVPAAARGEAAVVAERFGVRFSVAPRGSAGTPLRKPVIAAAAAADELFALREMGFEVRPVSTALLNDGAGLTGVDALVVSSGLSYGQLNPAAKAAVDALLARGGVVTRGATGAAFNAAAGLLPATAVAARGDANGVVSVQNTGPVVGAGSLPHSFVYSPLWFTGTGFTVEQRYAADPLVAGHWLPVTPGAGGPQQAAGQAAVVSGVTARGGRAVLFGTEPLFRAHPKGLYAQFARALYWAAQ
ncbi:M14 family zinc carboxypeptidase [Couchioplanes caeruleus]|uniref:Peptidase M28 n=2 Tax=Couchioplanes caeruleus TaxID=56438 RepID=A0A1K0GFV2_9ACTN|nr:M14 family zinc carboxypeptidase [Couchioplanes caeruleus]OJF09724.1 peptidase M28 [Couchioplanes caeruleus subsp. caeruleus]ROP27395.1 zinc carboxypeptidase [Couchioplanes caeruleus]